MSGAGGGRDHGGFYGDHPADGFVPFVDENFFFGRSAACEGGQFAGAGVDDDGMINTTPYSSITDYLQEFLQDPVMVDDAAVKQEMVVDHAGQQAAAPFTPNSSSCSDKKGRRLEEEEEEIDDEGSAVQSCKMNNNQAKKKGEKKGREPRVAFMTKSEVDHLEDGYRWRKSQQDASMVITTYEGQHTHPSPMGYHQHRQRSAAAAMAGTTAGGYYPYFGTTAPPSTIVGFCPDDDALAARVTTMNNQQTSAMMPSDLHHLYSSHHVMTGNSHGY
uniref:WRKY domain-containing protein n=1 Tax=Leersia perrieri TaxID=77586 RepID=A0A0D9WKA3_9ORYZ